nr:restriction endonuclease subunit S [Delftia acidovorans]
MSRYKAYPQYEKSKLQWADRTPKHWNSVHLRWIAKLYAGGTPSKAIEEYWENGSVPWINSGEVNQGLISEVSTYITEAAYKNSSAKWIPKNALVMALAGQGKTKGMIAQLAIDATCNQSMAAIVPQDLQSSRYLFWWLQSNYQNIRNMAGGDLRDGLNLELLGNIGCPIPNVKEQLSIAAFLDHETAKIDALIEKQQRLIELLKEKRQAVISHAVTKGLSPNAPMKDSGVEWLGEVPAHWALLRVKFVCSFTTSGPRGWSELVGETGSLFIQSGDLTDSLAVNFSGAKRVQVGNDGEAKRTALCNGDVVVCITGAKTGNVALCDFVPEDAYINQHLCLIRPTSIILSAFLAIQLKSSLGQNYFELSQYGLKQGLSLENVREAPVLIPPSKEQSAIVSYLNAEAEKFDVLSAKAQHSKELLQERRTALISAAVTGKIDVRDWQAAA